MPDHVLAGGDPDVCFYCNEPPRRRVKADGVWWCAKCRARYVKIWDEKRKETRDEQERRTQRRKKAPPRLAALALVASLQAGCGGGLDPYSWDDITCADELPSDPHEAYVEAIDRIYDLGGTVQFRPARDDGRLGKTRVYAARPCEVTLYDGWADTPFLMAAVPRHEYVHCLQPWNAEPFAREIPAIRQEMQVGRAIGTDEADLHDRAARFLDHHGWLTAENMDVVLDHCPGAATPEER